MAQQTLNMAIGADEEMHRETKLWRPHFEFIHGDPENPNASRITFYADALFNTQDHAYDYMRGVVSVMNGHNLSSFSNEYEAARKKRGKAKNV